MKIRQSLKRSAAVITAAAVLLPCAAPANCSLPFFAENVFAAEVFDLTVKYATADNYAADCILNGFVSADTGTRSDYSLFHQTVNRDFGYEEIARQIADNTDLTALSAFWTLTDALKEETTGLKALNETELYEVFLLDYLTYASQSAGTKSDLDLKTIKYSQKLYDAAMDQVTKNDGELTEEQTIWDKLTLADAQTIASEADFCENVIKNYTKVTDTLNESCKSAQEYLKSMAQAAALSDADAKRIGFLTRIREQASGNEALCTAIDNINDKLRTALPLIGTEELGKTAGEFASKYAWTALSASIPGMTAIELASKGMDLLFRTDDAAANNIRILMMYNVKLYAEKALKASRTGYLNSMTDAAASALNDDFLAYLNYQEYASGWTMAFSGDALLKSWANEIYSTFSDSNRVTNEYWDSRFSTDESFCKRAEDILNKYKSIYYLVSGQSADVLNTQISIPETDENSILEVLDTLQKPEYFTYSVTSALTLQEDMVINGNMTVRANINLNGHKLTVNGDIVHSSGTISFRGGRLEVFGNYFDYNISDNENSKGYENSDGKIVMSSDDDYFYVEQNIVAMLTNNAEPSIKAGTVEIKGNFYNFDDDFSGDTSTWIATGTSKLLLSGSSDQLVCFERYRTDGTTHFSNVTVNNADSRKILIDNTFSIGSLFSDGGTIRMEAVSTGSKLPIINHVKLNCPLSITGSLRIGRNFNSTENGVNWVTNEVIDLNGYSLTIDGNVSHYGGTINFNKGSLAINGDYLARLKNTDKETGEVTYAKANGILNMKNDEDLFTIGGKMHMLLQSKQQISAGTIEVGGDIENEGDTPFFMTGTSKMVLNSTKDQKLYFDYYWTDDTSHINTLYVKNSDSRSLIVPDIVEINSLTCDGSCVNMISESGKIGTLNIQCPKVHIIGEVAQLAGSVNLNGNALIVDGNYVQKNGTLNLGGGKMTVNGNFDARNPKTNKETGEVTYEKSEGVIQMKEPSDYLFISGDLISAYQSKQSIQEGTVELQGNLIDTASECIMIGGNSILRLSGEKGNQLNIDYYYSDDSAYHINQMTVSGSAKEHSVTLAKDTEIGTLKIAKNTNLILDYQKYHSSIGSIVMPVGTKITLSGCLSSDMPLETAVLSSSDETVIRPEKTSLYAEKTGTCTITIRNESGNEITLAVNVEEAAAPGLMGDLNNDGNVNLKDVVILRRYIAGGWGVTLDEKAADINSDGTINLKDAVLLRRYIAGGWNVQLPEYPL